MASTTTSLLTDTTPLGVRLLVLGGLVRYRRRRWRLWRRRQ